MADEPAVIEAGMPWWKKSVDEMVVAVVMGAVAIAAIFFLGEPGVPVAAVIGTGLSVYLKKDKSGNGE